MISLMYGIEAFQSVTPQTVVDYLRQEGWQKERNLGDKATIWTREVADGKRVEVLVPLQTDLVDYLDRMDDAFQVFEWVEKRPKSEIFNDLVDVRAIAADQQREVLNVHLNFGDQAIHPNHMKVEASAKVLGNILGSLQSLFDAIGQVKAGQASTFGKISQEITAQTQLSVLGTFRGSFGIRLAMTPPPDTEQLELAPQALNESHSFTESQPLGEIVVQEFVELLQDSREENVEVLSKRLASLQRRTVSNYQKFLQALKDSNTDIHLDWGSVNPTLGGSAHLGLTDVPSLVNVIQTIESTAPQDYEIIGELLAASKPKQTFELLDRDNEIALSGTIPDEVMRVLDEENLALTIGQVYVFTLREQGSVSSVTGEVKVGRSLLKIRPYRLA